MSEGLLQATVTAANTAQDSRKQFTKYEVEVRSSALVQAWVVYKRYNEFQQLHQEIAKHHPQRELPQLPSKKMGMRNLGTRLINTRRLELQKYLNALLNDDELLRSSPLLHFLQVEEGIRDMINRSNTAKKSIFDDSTAVFGRQLNADEAKAYRLVLRLEEDQPSKFQAIKAYEAEYFSTKANLGDEIINVLLQGVKDKARGLIETIGNFSNYVTARAALGLLTRLLSSERNLQSSRFVDALLLINPKLLLKMNLHKHIASDRNCGAFEVARVIYERGPLAARERLIADRAARRDFFRWMQMQDQRGLAAAPDAKGEFTRSAEMQDGEYKSMVAAAFEELHRISEVDQGWRFVADQTGKDVQVVYKKAIAHDAFILRVGIPIACPSKRVFELLHDISKRPRWDVKCLATQVLQDLGDGMDIITESYKSFISLHQNHRLCLLRAWKQEEDDAYSIVFRSVSSPQRSQGAEPVNACMAPSGFIITPYAFKDEEGNSVESSLLIWVAQLDKNASLIYSNDLLGNTDEIASSFHRLRILLAEQ